MRQSCLFPILVLLICLSSVAFSQAAPSSALSIGVLPSVQVPVAGSQDAFTVGGSLGLNLQYDFSQPTGVLLRGGVDYYYDPYLADQSLSLFAFHAGAGYQFAFTSRLRFDAFAGGGYNYGFKNGTANAGGSLYAEGGLGVDFILTPALGLSLGASYRYYAGLLHTVSAYLGAAYYLSGTETRRAQIQSSQPIDIELLKGYRTAPPGKGLSVLKVSIDPVFPVFRKYYDDHPVGTLVIRNNESRPVTGISASVNIKEYMNDPKKTEIGHIEPGATREVPVYALFNEHVLDTTEQTKTSAEILVDYRMDDANYRVPVTETVRLLDRNAMTWEDNRRAAAFVTAKDPAVLTFAKNVLGLMRDNRVKGLNDKLLAGFAMHQALGLYGLAYVVDPASSYAEQSKKKTDADFLQFPRQTLQYKAGDCDDLSILNAAMFEAVGIESAFITVPGHIFVAFCVDLTPEEARRTFSSTENLIFKLNKTWVPVEVTDIQNGFLSAWTTGAKEWREADRAGEAGFYPVREAWRVFESVGLPGTPPEIAVPPAELLRAALQKETGAYVDSELLPQAARLEEEARTAKDVPAAKNKVGVLYARYGRYEKAVAAFKQALRPREYLPALLNLANVSFLDKKWNEARQYYDRASKLDPLNPRVLLGAARAAFELEDYTTATKQYGYVKKLDPELAGKFAYLDQASSDSTRAANAAACKETVIWEESE